MINYKQNIKDFFFIKRDSFKSFNFTTILIFSIFQFFNLPISSQTTIDQQAYNYNTTNNQLTSITDTKLAGLSLDDIDNQNVNNYLHNANGQLTQDEAEGIVDIQWAVSGKVRKVFIDDDNDGTVDRTLSFLYDAMGFRVKKTETVLATITSPAIVSHTFYSRKATGELIAVYEKDEAGNIKRKEVSISIGSDKTDVDPTLVASSTTSNVYTRTLANKYFELKDQLGTVRTVVNNVKEDDGTGIFKATITSTSDNYAFGMELPNRTFNTNDCRYGFQGKEKDNELKGNGKSYDFGARLYDPRIGRWLSVDPKESNYPGISPYNAFTNNPISYTDPDGKAAKDVVFDHTTMTLTISADLYIYGSAVKAFREGRIPGKTNKSEILTKLGTDHLVGMISKAIENVWQITPSTSDKGISSATGGTAMEYSMTQEKHDYFLNNYGVDVPIGTYKVVMDINVQVYESDIAHGPDAATIAANPDANYVEVPWSDTESTLGFFEADGTSPSYIDGVGAQGGQFFMNSDKKGYWTWGHELFHTLGGNDKYDGVYQRDDGTGTLIPCNWNDPGAVRVGSKARPGYEDNMAAAVVDRRGNYTVADNRNVAEVVRYNAKKGKVRAK